MHYRSRTPLGAARLNLTRLLRADVRITPPPAGVVFERDVPVPVRDGVELRANVFRPEVDADTGAADGVEGPAGSEGTTGRWPVLLSAQPYGKDSLPRPRRRGRGYHVPAQYRLAANDEPMTFSAWTSLEAPDPGFWVPRGYVVVNVDLRGWGTSGGEAEPFGPTEGADVHDAVEWAASQPWSNGRVAMTGVSYLAISQWTGGAQRPPHLVAINPWEGFVDAYRDFAYPGGVREDGFARLWSAWQRLLRPRAPSFRAGQRAHPVRDEHWAGRAPAVEDVEVPALVCASFTDQGLHSAGSFAGYQRLGSDEKHLHTHRAPKWSPYYGGEGREAQVQFFDHHLQGRDTGLHDRPPVRVEVRSSLHDVVAVHRTDSWPPRECAPQVLHLDAAAGALSTTAPEKPALAGTRRGRLRFTWNVPDQSDLVGPMRLRVPVSAQREDLSLFAVVRKLHHGREVVFEGPYGWTEDVVTRGWLLASHRDVDPARSTPWQAWHQHTDPQPLPAGQVAELDLTLLPSATRFDAGDELVLELTDRWPLPVNPLTGPFPAAYSHTPRQHWAVHTGGADTGAGAATLTVPVWRGEPTTTDDPDHERTAP